MLTVVDVGPALCSDHNPEPTCFCGQNTACRTCRMGSGQLPCGCSPEIRFYCAPDLPSVTEEGDNE